jgi:regulator of sigma E protease
MIVLYIIIAIFVFGFMIFVHELGHFLFAKKFNVAINEFSIGMGPKIFSKKGKDGIDYSLRALPIGGYVAMEGEDEESNNPLAFNKKPAWQRFIIVIAGAMMNIIISVLILAIITACTPRFGTTVIYKFQDNATSDDSGLRINDEIIEIDGVNVHTSGELSYEIMRRGYRPVSVTVIRDGEEIVIDNIVFPGVTSDGVLFGSPDFYVFGEDRSFGSVIKNTFYTSKSTIKMTWDSLYDLFSGRYGIEQLSGPVGITGAITDAAKTSAESLFYLVAVIGINLGIFNLLPIPALDGGTLLLTLIEMITKKKLPRNIEMGIRTAGFMLLMLLAVVILFKDVIFLFK